MAKHTAEVYTDEELLALAQQCIADILAGGQSKTARGKILTWADLPKVRAEISRLETRILRKRGRPHTLVERVRR